MTDPPRLRGILEDVPTEDALASVRAFAKYHELNRARWQRGSSVNGRHEMTFVMWREYEESRNEAGTGKPATESQGGLK